MRVTGKILADFNLAVVAQTVKPPNLTPHQIFRLYSIRTHHTQQLLSQLLDVRSGEEIGPFTIKLLRVGSKPCHQLVEIVTDSERDGALMTVVEERYAVNELKVKMTLE